MSETPETLTDARIAELLAMVDQYDHCRKGYCTSSILGELAASKDVMHDARAVLCELQRLRARIDANNQAVIFTADEAGETMLRLGKAIATKDARITQLERIRAEYEKENDKVYAAKGRLAGRYWKSIDAIKGLVKRIAAKDSEIARLTSELLTITKLLSDQATEYGQLRGELQAVEWQGGPQAVVAAFREENERLRSELARVKGA